MNPQIERQTAQIFQFPPADVRQRLSEQRQAKWKSTPVERQAVPAVMGGAWYHDAAIAETDRDAKPAMT